MTGPLDIGKLSAAQSGSSLSESEMQEVHQYIAELEQRNQELEVAHNQDLAYGPGVPSQKTQMPDEKQLHFVYDTQPKKKEVGESENWGAFTFDETEILRQIQFGLFEPAERESLIREYADIQILRQQEGRQQVAINAMKRLHIRILSSKGLVLPGREPALVLLHQPTSKTVYEQKIPQQQPKATGFFSFLKR